MQSAQRRLRRSGSPRAVPEVISWWERLLDGPHSWGSFDAMVGRFGVRRYRLVVFPPGIGATGRRLLRLWRGWPVGGVVVTMLAVILAGDTLASARTTFLVAASAYLGVGMVLFAVTAGVRTGVRTMTVILLAGDIDEPDRRRYAQWELLVDLLTRADHMLEAGAINSAQHEALWWQAYDSLEVRTRV